MLHISGSSSPRICSATPEATEQLGECLKLGDSSHPQTGSQREIHTAPPGPTRTSSNSLTDRILIMVPPRSRLLLLSLVLLLAAQLLKLVAGEEFRDLTLHLQQFSGQSHRGYLWGTSPHPLVPRLGSVPKLWIDGRGEDRNARPRSYAAVSLEVTAKQFWGKRVRFRALVGRYKLIPSRGQYAALFVRVQATDGRTVAMDNMTERRICVTWPNQGIEYLEEWYQIVLDVPGPPENRCPVDRWGLPAFIQIGLLLVNGKGTGIATLSMASFDLVSRTEEPFLTKSAIVQPEGPPGTDTLY